MFVEREYQVKCEDAIFHEWTTHQSTLVEMATGLGKTIVFAKVIKTLSPKRALVLAHRNELIVQAKDKIEAVTGLSCQIEKAEQYASTNVFDRSPVVVSSIQSQISGDPMHRRYMRFKPEDFGVIIADECFPAGTLIDNTPIENLKIGDVLTTHLGVGFVRHIFKKKCASLVRLSFSDGRSIVCTPNHPIWTTQGFQPACQLTFNSVVLTIGYDEKMCNLPQSGQEQTLRESVLQSRIQSPNNTSVIQETRRGNYSVQENERYEQARSSGESFNITPGNGVETTSAKGKWLWTYNPSTGFSGGIRLGNGIVCADENEEWEWLSNLLQAGHWTPRFKNRDRSGWKFSLFTETTGAGQEERAVFNFARVDGVEILQPGCGDGFEQMCSDGFVYNLEVSNGNTYFANGVLVHNCHHSTSASWKEVITYYLRNPETKLLGVTATADRSDGEALGQIFKSCAFKYGILDAINDGWLVDITQQFVSVKSLGFSHVKTTCGDLNEGDLAKVMESEENIQGVCQPTLEAIYGLTPKTLSGVPVPQWSSFLKSLNKTPRRTIVFTVSVAQAEMCANIFLRAMDGVEWVCGETNKQKRKDILTRFLTGETSVVVNCGVLTEGYDNPKVELISVARPTKSRSLYCQIIGRSTRTLPGVVDGLPTAEDRRKAIAASPKPFCRILDFVGNSGRHKLVSCVDVLGGHVSEAAAEAAKKRAMDGGKPVRIMVTMTNSQIELERKKAEAAERARLEKEARRRHLLARVDYSAEQVDAFGGSRQKVPFTNQVSRDGREFSEKQLKVLRLAGCDPAKIGYRQGQAIIAKQIEKWEAEKRARNGVAA